MAQKKQHHSEADLPTLNVIGCGNLGQSLAQLWSRQRVFRINGVVTRSIDSAQSAVDFIGEGKALDSIQGLQPAPFTLIATPDSSISEMAMQLAGLALIRPGDVVFHCSGALSSSILSLLQDKGASIASIHPVKSFAVPEKAVCNFDGTCCGAEGDDTALASLSPAFETIGGQLFNINPEHKTLYHAGSVMVCNYLTALMESGIQTYQQAGLSRDIAMKIMQPIVIGTVNNVFELGTVDALTGPIARGDVDTVRLQLDSLKDWRGDYAELYRRLGQVTLELSKQQGSASDEDIARLRQLLDSQ